MKAVIRAIATYLPETVLTNEAIAAAFPDWPADKVEKKLGIRERHIAGPQEFTSNLAVSAAEKLFTTTGVDRASVDALIVVTQTPDYLLPTTACVVQHALRLPNKLLAFDLNLGCSGFVYGLSVAKSLVETGLSRRLLLITADTYTKLLDPTDQSVRTLFGDGAAATLIEGVESERNFIGSFDFGTDGSGAADLMAHGSGMRPAAETGLACLRMNGGEVFAFTLRVVPPSVEAVLAQAGLALEQIDLFVFHQANSYLLEHLRQKCRIPRDKFVVAMAQCGNTVSSSIPMALGQMLAQHRLQPGAKVMLSGFGVGTSWATCIVEWA
ncbi:MAG: ketoacyl-ACP synthase III [Verrucomicrobiota bacterium]